MNRRALVRGALATGLAAPVGTALSAARQGLDSALEDRGAADLTHWEETVERRAHGYDGRSPADLLPDLGADSRKCPPCWPHRARLPLVPGCAESPRTWRA
ncbi:hypothetical protein STBA_62840 [Streptomyces sp. MP131-18]|nr:hypothetical protein STBA_62840 [Streptomyces sp. MP131-18]